MLRWKKHGFLKRMVLFVVLFMILAFTHITNAYNMVGLENFEKKQSYNQSVYVDVSEGSWYSENIATVHEYGLMIGGGDYRFMPEDKISVAQSLTLAVRLHSTYWYGEEAVLFVREGMKWYDPYIAYAEDAAIFTPSINDHNTPATRAVFAKILATSVDTIDLKAINLVEDGAIPDVDMSADYADAVYLLYRAGILTGSDAKGTFQPDSTVTRAEAAAIVTRIVDPTLRKNIELSREY